MLIGPERVSGEDLAELARLQVEVLPTSMVSRLGAGYARAFYRFVTRSEHELLLVARNNTGRIVGGCVVSLDISSFQRRLALSTPLVPAVLVRPAVLLSALGGNLVPPSEVELVLLFTNPSAQGTGVGSSLMSRCEHELARRGVTSYFVRTFADASDPAQHFYRARGFRQTGEFTAHGRRFALLQRTLNAA